MLTPTVKPVATVPHTLHTSDLVEVPVWQDATGKVHPRKFVPRSEVGFRPDFSKGWS